MGCKSRPTGLIRQSRSGTQHSACNFWGLAFHAHRAVQGARDLRLSRATDEPAMYQPHGLAAAETLVVDFDRLVSFGYDFEHGHGVTPPV